MITKNLYSLSIDHLFEEISDETKQNIYGFCAQFMESGQLENSDWKIIEAIGEHPTIVTIINKSDFKKYEVIVDEADTDTDEYDDIWKEIAEEDRKYEVEIKRINDRLLNVITSLKGKEFAEDLIFCATESEVQGSWEIVRETKGSYQKESDYGLIKGFWVDQWRNGGMEGDDFAGDIYVELKENRYLKMGYAC